MFNSYADTITVSGRGADENYTARIAEHLNHLPAGPVKISGGPGTGKSTALANAVRESGYRLVAVDSAFRPHYLEWMKNEIEAGTNKRCVLVIDEVEHVNLLGPEAVAGLAELAGHPAVVATFVVETTMPELVPN